MTDPGPSDLVPIFDAINLESNFLPRYYLEKDITPNVSKYRFHINLIHHSGLYWITTMVTNLDSKSVIPIIITEIFSEDEKLKLTKYINLVINMAEKRDWNFLWFSDGKRMERQQYSELRTLWMNSLVMSN